MIFKEDQHNLEEFIIEVDMSNSTPSYLNTYSKRPYLDIWNIHLGKNCQLEKETAYQAYVEIFDNLGN